MARETYYLFIDETGDHGLTQLNATSPVFLLCGILISAADYQTLDDNFNAIKNEFWGKKEVIFHSRDIRKCQKEFQILFDIELKGKFYEKLNRVVSQSNYHVIASSINKDKYIKQFGLLSNDVYELSLSFIIERAIFCLDGINKNDKEVNIVIEERGKKEDKRLREHFQRLLSRGTGYVTALRLNKYNLSIHFRGKQKNINGLQLADLCAYPLGRYVLEPDRANPSLDVFFEKIYKKNGKNYGLKVYP
jgi:hypothetical protein